MSPVTVALDGSVVQAAVSIAPPFEDPPPLGVSERPPPQAAKAIASTEVTATALIRTLGRLKFRAFMVFLSSSCGDPGGEAIACAYSQVLLFMSFS